MYSDTTASANDLQELALLGVERIRILERTWSRFIPTSELSRLNAHSSGQWITVSNDLLELVSAMKAGFDMTDGAFDPTVYDSLINLGYTRDIDSLQWLGSYSPTGEPAPGLEGLDIDVSRQAIRLPSGVHLDPGGIGKGLAADIVGQELLDTGISGALVDIGGDLSLSGTIPGRDQWHIDVSPRTHQARSLSLPASSDSHLVVATSGLKTRQWGEYLFHVVDPRSGLSATSDASEVTVIAEGAWVAEVCTKATLLARDPAAFLQSIPCVGGLIFWQDGSTYQSITEPNVVVT